MTKEQALNQLNQYEKTSLALNHAGGVLYYDGVTAASKGSYEIRAVTAGELSRMQYELITDAEFIEALEVLRQDNALTPVQKRLVSELYRDYERRSKIPKEEAVAFDIHVTEAEAVWDEAKNNSDFAAFEPYLQKNFDTMKRFASYTDPDRDPYEVYLDRYERGLTRARCDGFFAALRKRLVPLIERVANAPQPDRSVIEGEFPVGLQRELTEKIISVMDIDRRYLTVGETEHPFTTSFTKKDTRITTHYYESDVASSLYSVIHEGGHALYDMNSDDSLFGSSLEGGVSMGIHESQSRFYENIIGRSLPFCEVLLPILRETFPGRFDKACAEDIYRAVNRSQPSLIRTEADELTYSLHIMIRYELEKMMFDGVITAHDLPHEWNRLYKEYLGIDVPDDKHGVLQDSHWAGAAIGYFPSYALGSAYGAQYLREMKKDLDVDAAVRSGKLTQINAWLRERIWKHGCMLDPSDLFESVCGSFDPNCYADYLEEKFTRIYGL